MSKGSPRVVVRLPHELLAEVEAAIERSTWSRRRGPFNFAEFVRIATVEKLRKMERCRRPRGASRQQLDQAGYSTEAPNEFNALGLPVSSGVDTVAATAVSSDAPTGG